MIEAPRDGLNAQDVGVSLVSVRPIEMSGRDGALLRFHLPTLPVFTATKPAWQDEEPTDLLNKPLWRQLLIESDAPYAYVTGLVVSYALRLLGCSQKKAFNIMPRDLDYKLPTSEKS
jgi:hypothetical protein